MKIFDKNYVGVNHKREDITVAPLAFLTPYEDNAAGKKRQESVDQWLSGRYWEKEDDSAQPDVRILPNKPQTGFRVVDVASRWSTSNKFARIYDPSGFELEISIDNLVDLMLYSVVDHGEIQGELIWARDGAHNRLIPVTSDLYKNALREGQVLEPEVGDIIEAQHGYRYVYLGTGYLQPVGVAGKETVTKIGSSSLNWPFVNHGYRENYSIEPEFIATRQGKGAPQHIYYYLPQSKYGQNSIVSRKAPMKVYAIVDKSDMRLAPNKVYRWKDGAWHNAAGTFATDYNYADGQPYHTRACMVRPEPFTKDDIAFESVLAQIAEIN